MFEARLVQGVLLRKLLDSMKDLVQVDSLRTVMIQSISTNQWY